MRRKIWASFVCASGLVLACSDDGTAESATLPTSTTDTTETSTTEAPTTGVPTTTDDPTDGDSDTSDSTTTTTTGTTTGDPITGTTAVDTTTGTTGPDPTCGNAALDGDEACDGTELGGATCESEGFDGGTLACQADCTALDTSGCTVATCGNGGIDGQEACDGADLGDETCVSQGFEGGTLACAANCMEFDTTQCATCGNDALEVDEVCDGTALGGETCETQGFAGGQLACQADCSGLDTTGCTTCGDGDIDADEQCDGADLGGATCQSLGLGNGDVTCTASCEFDTSACVPSEGLFVTVRAEDNMLRKLDPDTLVFTDIAPLTVDFDFGDLAWDEADQILYMIDGRPAESLWTVDLVTAGATLVGVHGIEDLFGLAWDPTTGKLHAGTRSPYGFYEVNQATGAATWIGNPNLYIDGLTYDSKRDELIAIAGGEGSLFKIDRLTGAPTVLSNNGFINDAGLAYHPGKDLFYAIDWSGNLYTFDPNNGYGRTQLAADLDPHDGMEFIPGLAP
ncbi:hypothetical protein [Nannocystis radixulma]|uniref:Myxococcus cysteine-rich repeat-containing protein n=1 Tax=Nannocystis radixulma TaxID=2995305 RepID=A0ABT5AZ47_9BACT|nr:hypothetical protein [Nannocystis radixulma]MDC0667114.1 hypothetical protein [Nannocystis radixulma]